ncbi:hypothetical protein D9753_09360 [Streptomyces dangxiongensis]|uniref:Uncharacterized protein n=1 Tax=Streptomyces dangxiongensis TaxID=1442032 RepID=A0A3G2J9W9_9ACTN|nr:hypothetical protein D9753_09360 [Streptomyces dangxiongensis]
MFPAFMMQQPPAPIRPSREFTPPPAAPPAAPRPAVPPPAALTPGSSTGASPTAGGRGRPAW